MLADNKFTASFTSSAFEKLVLAMLEILSDCWRKQLSRQCHLVGGVSNVKTCNCCHVPVMFLSNSVFTGYLFWRSHAPSAREKSEASGDIYTLTSSLGMQLATLWSSWVFGPKRLASSMESSCFTQALCCLFCNTSARPLSAIASCGYLVYWLGQILALELMQCSGVTRPFAFFSKCNRTIGSRSIGHRVWSMSLNILTELSVN